MKNAVFVFSLCFISFLAQTQIMISEIADPNDDASCRYVQLTCKGPANCNMNNLRLARWTNESANFTSSTTIDLSPLGILSVNDIVVISNNSSPGGSFVTCYGFEADITAGSGGPADSNGDDQIGIIDPTDAIIDIFGVPGEDGTGTCHEFEDGKATRKSSTTSPNSVFDESEWDVFADTEVMGCTSHTNTPQNISDLDPSMSSLPVEIKAFTGKSKSGFSKLSWTTSTEINNDYFIVERSSDRRSFTEIGKVMGNGTTSEEINYEFIDRKPTPGMNYYRLAQYDFNGEMEYHKTIAVENRVKTSSVFPTIVSNFVNVSVQEPATLHVRDLGGTLIFSQQIEESGSVSLSDVPSGSYVIQIVTERVVENHRVVKQ